MLRLCRMLGKTLYELEATMTKSELKKWAIYMSKEPSNSVELQLALLTTVASNMMGGKHKLDDFYITQYKIDTPSQAEAKPMAANAIRSKFSNLL